MIVGEAPSQADFQHNAPFGGGAGLELNRLLHEAGIMRSECYTTYVCKIPPPEGQLSNLVATKKKDIGAVHVKLRDLYVLPQVVEGYNELLEEIKMVQPNIIVALGNLAMFVLTGHWSAAKWRGSLLTTDDGAIKVIPTLPPSTVFKQFELRGAILNDLRRVKRHMTSRVYDNKPAWNFLIRPAFDLTMRTIAALTSDAAAFADPVWLDFDIETRYEQIDCIGFSWSRTDAICIPLIARGKPEGYWNADEEAAIVFALYKLLTHPNVRCRWQNGLYDAQYVFRHWHFIPRHGQDTMITQHSLFAALPKGLGFIASLYADWYVYWKDEGKIASDVPEEQRWAYNLQDCIYTRECGEVLLQAAEQLHLAEVDKKQQALFLPVLHSMLRGVRIRQEVRQQMALDIQEELSHREAFLFNILGHLINPASPKQMQALFYEDLRLQPVLKRTMIAGRMTMRPTCDDEALTTLAIREPLIKPLCNAIADIRTLNKFLGDFVMMPLDSDGRMRCSFNIAGDAGGKSAPYSYRLSSSKNPFGSGGNLQTIPSEKSKSSGKAAARGSMDFTLPNIRSMYGPDPGFTFFDMDLDRADLQVVVWEAEDVMLKAALRLGADIHLLNTYGIDNVEPPPLEELVERHKKGDPCTCGPRCYWDYRTPRSHKREFAKVFCHATNYLGKPKTVAAHTGRTVHEIDSAQKRWFAAHPGILAWHRRVTEQVLRHRFVENKFGYRWNIFDRIDEHLLPAAVAWIPQSTVGIVINSAWRAFYEQLPEVQVLLQVHDSLAGQFPTHRRDYVLPRMAECSKIVIPYDDPLIIPTGVKTSVVSWGDCE
jgi:DNA polymerase I-like protein with 3'-5' exonuclease and polymerase domains/uracil-DNA glycosylase